MRGAPSLAALLCASSLALTLGGPGTMGPLLADTTAADAGHGGSGGCIAQPGTQTDTCVDVGVLPNAAACAAFCAAAPWCSAVTWHGLTTGEWAGHCVARFDGDWAPRACGAGCDHVASNKTGGWVPGPPPPPPPPATLSWIPSTLPWGRVKAFWFGANASGLDNDDTLALIAKHAVGGYGWQTGHPGGGTIGVGEELQTQAATHLRDYLQAMGHTTTGVFEYRQIQVALRLFALCALAADDPTNEHFFLHNAAAFDAEALQSAKNAVYARQTHAMNAAGIIPIFSLDNRLTASSVGTSVTPPCALPEDDLLTALAGLQWVRFYENWPQSFWTKGGADLAVAMHQNAILEAAAGVPTVLHMGAQCPAVPQNITIPGRLGGDIEFAIGSYLIVAGTGTTLSLSRDWYDSDFCWHAAFDVDYGSPLGTAVRDGYVFSRNYTKARATIDVSTSTAVVMLLGDERVVTVMSWSDDGAGHLTVSGASVVCVGGVSGSKANALFSRGGSGTYSFTFSGSSGAWVGVTTASRFAPGWRVKGLLYGGPGNLSDGGALIAGGWGPTFGPGDVLTMRVEEGADRVTVAFSLNGEGIGVAFDVGGGIAGGPLFPLVCLDEAGQGVSVTCDALGPLEPFLRAQDVRGGIEGAWEGRFSLHVAPSGGATYALACKVANTHRACAAIAPDGRATLQGAVASTRMMPPPHLRIVEQEVSTLLLALSRVVHDGDALVLEGGGRVERFVRSAPPPAATREGVHWLRA